MWAYCEVLGDVECGLNPYGSKYSSWSFVGLVVSQAMTCHSSARTCCDFVLCGGSCVTYVIIRVVDGLEDGERVRVREWTEVSWTVRGRCDNSEEGCWPHALRTSSTLHSTLLHTLSTHCKRWSSSSSRRCRTRRSVTAHLSLYYDCRLLLYTSLDHFSFYFSRPAAVPRYFVPSAIRWGNDWSRYMYVLKSSSLLLANS